MYISFFFLASAAALKASLSPSLSNCAYVYYVAPTAILSLSRASYEFLRRRFIGLDIIGMRIKEKRDEAKG